MNYQLKSPAEIDALVANPKVKTPSPERRSLLAGKVTSAPDDLLQVLPVMISTASNADEADFLRSLVTEIPPVPAATPKQAGAVADDENAHG